MADASEILERLERERPERLTAAETKEVQRFASFSSNPPLVPLSQIILNDSLRYALVDDEFLRDDIALPILNDRLSPTQPNAHQDPPRD